MFNDEGMRMINIKTTTDRHQLLNALKKNREIHQHEYKEAVKGYWEKVQELSAKIHNRASKMDGTFHPKVNELARLSIPVDNTKKYDNLIKQLEMSKDSTLELDSTQFNCIVNDEWDWAVSAKTLNSSYMR